MKSLRLLRAAAAVWVFVSVISKADAQAPVEPLLQKYCLGCHNDTDKEAGLSLQTPDSLKKGGDNGPVFDPGQPSKSLLMQVLVKGADNAMPPEDEPQPTDAEREQLRKWVLSGAKIQSMAAGRPNVPDVKPFEKVIPALLASACSADGRSIAVGGGRYVALADVGSGKSKWRAVLEDSRVAGLSFASTKPWIVAAAGVPGVGGKAVILSAEDGGIQKEFGGHTDAVYAAVMNASDTLLATAGYDRRILLHDVATGKVLRRLKGHNGSVFSLSFDDTGKVLCSASADGTVKVWNTETGERLDTLSQPQGEQYSVLVSGKRIFAAGADNRIRIWKLTSVSKARINPILVSRFAHEQAITRLALSADGKLLASAAEDGTVRVWTTSPLQYLQSLPLQKSAVTSLSFVGNERLFLTRLDGSSQLVDVKSSADGSTGGASGSAETVNVDLPDKLNEITEQEGNNTADTATAVTLPVKISGVISPDGGNDRDADCFRFSAKAGQQLVLEVRAQRDKSPLDSKIEVLTADGRPIVRTKLQAVRDSYFTFRGKDSDTSDDFRVFNWQEMELNEFLYADGEVVKLWHYPRGTDSGYMVYPGFGKRFTYFDTTPTAHALQAPCFIVVPRGPDETITPNGLPVFPVFFENDDDARRELGRDSRLFFKAPADGDYVVRLTDARGFSGPEFKYRLTVRSPKPSVRVSVSTRKLTMAAGTGREILFSARRIDGYEGPVTIDMHDLPEGFGFSGPIVIQHQQLRAYGTVYATNDAKQPSAEDLKKVRITAGSEALGEMELGTLEELKLASDTKLKVRIVTDTQDGDAAEGPPVLTIHPGETIQARVLLDRLKHNGVVSFGKSDAGRNLPHGVYVDNIGLNGLLLLSEQSEREFFITASKTAVPSVSTFFLKANIDGVTSFPVTLRVTDPAEGRRQVTTR